MAALGDDGFIAGEFLVRTQAALRQRKQRVEPEQTAPDGYGRIDPGIATTQVGALMQHDQGLFLDAVVGMETRRQHDARTQHPDQGRQSGHLRALPAAIVQCLQRSQRTDKTLLLPAQPERTAERADDPQAKQGIGPAQPADWQDRHRQQRPDVTCRHRLGHHHRTRRRQQHRQGRQRHHGPQAISGTGAQMTARRGAQQQHQRTGGAAGQGGLQQDRQQLSAVHRPAP